MVQLNLTNPSVIAKISDSTSLRVHIFTKINFTIVYKKITSNQTYKIFQSTPFYLFRNRLSLSSYSSPELENLLNPKTSVETIKKLKENFFEKNNKLLN